MSPTKPLPETLQRWAEQRIGPVVSVRDASHDWDRSRVWDLEGERGVHHYLKVSPSVKFFTRESRAYRHIVPALGHTRAPHLIDSRAQDLALLLTAAPGAPAKELGLDAVEWRTVHQQAGALCARLHEAGELDRGSPTAFGLIMGVGGAGSLAGALLAPRIASRIGIGPTIIIGFAVSPLAQIPLLLAGAGLRWQIALAGTLAVQLFWATASGTSQRSLRQILCEPHFQGRIQAASTTVTAGARPLAAAAAGALVSFLGVRGTLTVGAVLQIVPVILLLASPVRALRDMPVPPARTAVPPARERAS
ncbi:MFS transporter [Streptomyces europaeiscabiei]|uniref:hypothetical protein n=1 Tax=Streptomyces europaeiscabiei TaxID=146819 RepID=UPI0038F7C271